MTRGAEVRDRQNADLTLALADMQVQSELYRPTVFWQAAAARIAEELNEHGMERFRALEGPLWYFVPTYGVPGNGFTASHAQALRELVEKESGGHKRALALSDFLSGAAAARADFRVLVAADDPSRLPHLHEFSESVVGSPIEQFEFNGRRVSRSALNYSLGLALLKRYLGDDVPRTVLEIGGGFGTLGEILAQSKIPNLRYIDVDIPPTCFAAQYYLGEVLGASAIATYGQTRELSVIEIGDLPTAAILCPWQLERLRGEVDLFVNFISFQEMEPAVVKNYLTHVRRLGARWVLLRNLREGKQARRDGGHGVDQPVRADDYLAMLPGYELIERNVLPFGYRTVDGFHSELLLLRKGDGA
jgi:putative sugar O-methyltransferase